MKQSCFHAADLMSKLSMSSSVVISSCRCERTSTHPLRRSYSSSSQVAGYEIMLCKSLSRYHPFDALLMLKSKLLCKETIESNHLPYHEYLNHYCHVTVYQGAAVEYSMALNHSAPRPPPINICRRSNYFFHMEMYTIKRLLNLNRRPKAFLPGLTTES